MKKFVKKILTLCVAVAIASSLFTVNAQPNAAATGDSDFGVGQGVKWDSQVFAPFVDFTAWVGSGNPYASDITNGGCLDIAKVAEETGVKFYNLGFINADHSGNIVDGVLDWSWGGYKVLSEKYSDGNQQYADMKRVISDIRDIGGDVIISVGGALENNFFQKTSDIDVLEKTYLEVINGYGLTRIDLDLEGGAQGYNLNVPNAKALKKVQDATGVEIVLTLPVLPSGLTSLGLDTLNAYLDNGVDVSIVNIMTMCYGTATLLPGENYGTASVRAVDTLMTQLKTAYAKHGKTLSDAESYAKIGTTVSIGFESSAHPVFPVEYSQIVVDHAKEKSIGMVSFWSMNRDSKTQANPNINQKFEHTEIFKTFSDGGSVVGNKAPKISGVSNKSITIGDSFDPMAGVTANDKEDGDLTSKIVVTGSVDTSKIGTYNVTYTVADSAGKTATATATIKVIDKVVETVIKWTLEDQAAGLHVPGILVSHNGAIYKQVSSGVSWWCEPGSYNSTSVWKKVGDDENHTDPEATVWNTNDQAAGKYTPGVVVSHKGIVYKQISTSVSWWCEPGSANSSSVWQVIGNDDGYVEPNAKEWNLEDQSAGKYTPNVKVIYKNIVYRQIGTSTCWWGAPDVTPNFWQAV